MLFGTVTYRQRMALAPGSVVEVRVEGGASGSPAVVLGSTRIETTGQVPISFQVELRTGNVGAPSEYAVSARISGPDGRPLFVSAEPHRVPMDAMNELIDLVLVPAGRMR